MDKPARGFLSLCTQLALSQEEVGGSHVVILVPECMSNSTFIKCKDNQIKLKPKLLYRRGWHNMAKQLKKSFKIKMYPIQNCFC
jgi:hypothetical protein